MVDVVLFLLNNVHNIWLVVVKMIQEANCRVLEGMARTSSQGGDVKAFKFGEPK